jgi:NADPH-dependent curcumin reductase CurA
VSVGAVNRRWLLAARPDGEVRETDFALSEAPVPPLAPGEFLVRTVYLSLAPVMRDYMFRQIGDEPPVPIGGTMRGRGVGQIVASRHPDWNVGEVVHGPLGWQDYAVLDGNALRLTFKVKQRIAPVSTALGVLGITGFTAYFGLIDLCTPQPGETVVVSGAAGGVGSIVGQLARIQGCRAVAIAGGPEKCRLAVESLGYHAAVDYRNEDVAAGLQRECPDGIDVYFDNVGGPTLNAALQHLRRYGRVSLCGRISDYLAPRPFAAYDAFPAFLSKRALMKGFFIYDYAPRFGEAEAAMSRWVADGSLRSHEDVLTGLESMPRALARLYRSENRGKQLVQVADDPAGWPRRSGAA